MSTRPPIALTVAGTDPSGGAGVHADLKSFTARGVYGTSVITALVVQNTHGVTEVHGVPDEQVRAQFAAVCDDMEVDALKTGMLGTRSLVELTVDEIRTRRLPNLVVDPVMVATSGHRLLDVDAVDSVRTLLVREAALITPNLPEAALLLGDDVPSAADADAQRQQAVELVRRGARAVLLKGGHMETGELLDVLAVADGDDVALSEFRHERIVTEHTHGTGCTLSAAVAAELAAAARRGADTSDPAVLETASAAGLDYLARALASGARWQIMRDPTGAHGPVDHTVDIERSGR